jgi:hypothetical protein
MWDGEIDLDELRTAMVDVFDGKHVPYFREVDTASDMSAIVVSTSPIDPKEAQKLLDDMLSAMER